MAVRRPRRSLVVLAGGTGASDSDHGARALVASLGAIGIEAVYLGREESAQRIATAVAEENADAVELLLAAGGVLLLRELLRELIRLGRRDVSIVVHRAEPVPAGASAMAVESAARLAGGSDAARPSLSSQPAHHSRASDRPDGRR